MTYQLKIDPIKCTAHGLCAELYPERIWLDDWRYPVIEPGSVPASEMEHARRAVAACPAIALRLVKD